MSLFGYVGGHTSKEIYSEESGFENMWLIRRHPANSAAFAYALEACVQQHEHMLNYLEKSRRKKPAIRQDDRATARSAARAYAVGMKNSSATLMDYSMSYSHPTDQTAAVAAALAELGVRPEERVLIMLPDSPGFAEAFASSVPPVPLDAVRDRRDGTGSA